MTETRVQAKKQAQSVGVADTELSGVEPGSWVGRSIPRTEDPALLRGFGQFVSDIIARDSTCLHAKFVRSPIAAGRLISVTTQHEVKLFTAKDLDGVSAIAPVLNRPDYVRADTPILAQDEVRFVGEPIGVVLAHSEAAAEDAVEMVDVQVEAWTPLLTIEQSTHSGARLVHPGPYPSEPNTVIDGRLTTPGFTEMKEQAGHAITVDVSCARQSAMPLETRASHAAYDHGTGRVTLHTATQMPHVVRTGIAECLGIDESDIRVIAPDVGGAFGAKMGLAREDVLLVFLARQLRRNIAWIESRDENFLAAWHSREQRYQVTGFYNNDGELLGIEADLVANVGAYSVYPVTFGVEPLMAFAELPGPYAFAQYSVRSRGVLSNKCPIAPYRGVSRPVQTLAMETLMDHAADVLGIDPFEIRFKNLIRNYPHKSPSGITVDPSSHIEALERARKLADMEQFRKRQRAARKKGRYLGLGFASFAERTGYGTPAFAARSMGITPGYEQVKIEMDPSGMVALRIGASPHGQGLRTTLAQVVADELGIDPSRVRVIHSDTDTTPYGWGSFASRAMVIAGGATMLASQKLRERLRAIAAHTLECDVDDLEIVDGVAKVRGTDVQVSLADIARVAHLSSHLLPEGFEPGLTEGATYNPSGTFSNAVHVVEVEVNPETGQVHIERFLVVEDAGVLVNPSIVDGQVRGGIAQGIANALLEELIYDEQGNLTTTSLMDFLPPTMSEMPHVEIHHLATISDFTLTGAKGVGEGGTIGAPAAIINAINDALKPLDVYISHIPATPSRIRQAIRTSLNPDSQNGAPS